MPIAKLMKRTVDAARPGARPYIIFDEEVRGFGLRVMPSGFKSWIIEYRPRGAGRDAGKKRLTLGSHTTLTAAQARKIAKDTLAGVRSGVDPLAERAALRTQASVNDVAPRFLAEHVERLRKPSTARLYRLVINGYLLPQFGSRKVASITRAEVLKLHSSMTGTPVLANRTVAVLGSMLSWAAKAGLVPEGFNPAAKFAKNPEKSREKYLSTTEIERLGAALRDAETIGIPWVVDETHPKAKHVPKAVVRRTVLSPHVIAAVRLLLLLGTRRGEVLNLRWNEIDFERGLLLLPDSKTGKKTIILNAPALAVLEGIPRIGEFVIASAAPRPGQRERPRHDIHRAWSAIRRHAGLDGLRLHDLRHSFASVGAGAGLGLPIVGKLLGHTNAATTQRYAHLDADPLRRASDAISAAIAAAMDGKKNDNVVPIDPRHSSQTGRADRIVNKRWRG
jgi:integrase